MTTMFVIAEVVLGFSWALAVCLKVRCGKKLLYFNIYNLRWGQGNEVFGEGKLFAGILETKSKHIKTEWSEVFQERGLDLLGEESLS